MKKNTLLAAALVSLLLPAVAFAGATITIVNIDGVNEGFNDPTPAAAVPAAIKGDNPGATLGEMRLNVFQFGADIWGSKLDSNVEIFVTAAFNPLPANVLGSAGTTFVFRDFPANGPFPGAEFPSTWYHSALTDKRLGAEANPGFADINAQFSSNFVFYLGFDNNEGALVDLLPVVLHEIGHGLGFSNFVNEGSGANFAGFTDIYSHFTLDATTGQHWNAMTDAQRMASAINVRNVVWDGDAVTDAVPDVLALGVPQVLVNAPAGIGTLNFGEASFGPLLTPGGTSGNVALANDGVGATTDACTPLVGFPAGNVALVDRGTCTFVVKVANAQAAGAIGVIVADNVAGSPPPGLAGVDPTITIPSGRITLADGNTLKAALLLGPVNVTLFLNNALRAGANLQGFAQLWAVIPVALGSSISHWDVIARPNQLMEPAINTDLTNGVEPPVDLTLPLFRDIGWFPDGDLDGIADDGTDQCLGSDLGPTVVIDGCDSGVPNTFFASGCTITDLVMNCAPGARNHGQFVSCVAHTLNGLKKAGIITGAQKGAIQSCAAGADIP